MVEGAPFGLGPPSRYTRTDSPSWSTASCTSVAAGCPDLLALETAIGPCA